MTDSNNSPPPTPTINNNRRRSSFTGAAFADLFGRGSGNTAAGSPPNYSGPISSAAAQANRRRLSLSTLGLSGSPNQTSPFGSVRSRGESISSNGSGSIDESAVEDGDVMSASTPATPFARRMSFGARALRDVKTGGGVGGGTVNGRASINKSSPAPTNKSRGDGFNWSENLRTRAERSSIAAPTLPAPSAPTHQRAKSVTIMEPPVREIPKQPKAPDAFQERILKGDFYMD